MKRRQLIALVVVAGVLAILVTANLRRNDGQRDAFEIASVLPLTGPAAEFGADMKRGHELAVEYFNAHHDPRHRVRVVFEDSRSTPADGLTVVQSLLARGYQFFIIPLSSVGMAVRPSLIDAGVLAFLDASHPGLTRPPHPLIFRHSQTAEAEARAIASAASRPGLKKLVVFYLNDEYGRTFFESIRNTTGITVPVSGHAYETGTTDFRTLVHASNLSSTEGAIPVVVGVGRPLGLLIRAVREYGYNGVLFASLGYIATGAQAVMGEDRANIVYTDLSWHDTDATAWLEKEYMARFGEGVPAVAALEFQTLLIIATAASEVEKVTPSTVAEGIPDAARTVTGKPPNPANDIFPLVVLKVEPDGRTF